MKRIVNQIHSYSLLPEQKLQLSLAMQESLCVLQMPIDELSSWLEKSIETNPALDWKGPINSSHAFLLETESAYEPSLYEHLMNQARQSLFDENDLRDIEWIIGNLNETGYFEAEEAYEDKNHNLLLRLQTFDPPGIGARNLKECLLLQLKAEGKQKSLGYFLLDKYFEDLIEGDLVSLQKKSQISLETLKKTLQNEIACLDPFPGLRFQRNTATSQCPDVYFIEEGSSWRIEVNDSLLTSYHIKSLDVEFKSLNPEEKTFCRPYIAKAKWMEKMVYKRHNTLKAVSLFIAKKQLAYLQENSPTLDPLSIRDIAEALDMHESTVARALSQKSLACKWGTFPLKNLLSKPVSKQMQNISSDKAQKLLLKLIADENKKSPLSDQELVMKLRDQGIHCARRTVTKYRQNLKIPAAFSRKKTQNSPY